MVTKGRADPLRPPPFPSLINGIALLVESISATSAVRGSRGGASAFLRTCLGQEVFAEDARDGLPASQGLLRAVWEVTHGSFLLLLLVPSSLLSELAQHSLACWQEQPRWFYGENQKSHVWKPRVVILMIHPGEGRQQTNRGGQGLYSAGRPPHRAGSQRGRVLGCPRAAAEQQLCCERGSQLTL